MKQLKNIRSKWIVGGVCALFALQILAKIQSITFEQTQKKIDTIKDVVTSLSFKIGQKSNEYIDHLKKIEECEKNITSLFENLKISREELKAAYHAANTNLKLQYLQEINGPVDSADLLSRHVLTLELKNNLIAIEKLLGKIKNKEDELSILNKQLVDFRETEVVLMSSLVNMQLQAKNYREEMSKSKVALDSVKKGKITSGESDLSKKLRESIFQSIGETLRSPLLSSEEIKHDHQGITFKVKRKTPVIASGGGTIAYEGVLSHYGRVLIIDHGLDWRSIYLGDFIPKVKKDEVVKQGRILAELEATKQLYFEVRKKGLAQNTYLIFAKEI